MPKYKIGDRFMFHGAVREIAFAHEDSFKYVVVYEESDEADFVTEGYIDEFYTKIEPFFEEGKAYTWDPREMVSALKSRFFIENLLSSDQALARRFAGGEFDKYVILDKSAFGMMVLDD